MHDHCGDYLCESGHRRPGSEAIPSSDVIRQGSGKCDVRPYEFCVMFAAEVAPTRRFSLAIWGLGVFKLRRDLQFSAVDEIADRPDDANSHNYRASRNERPTPCMMPTPQHIVHRLAEDEAQHRETDGPNHGA